MDESAGSEQSAPWWAGNTSTAEPVDTAVPFDTAAPPLELGPEPVATEYVRWGRRVFARLIDAGMLIALIAASAGASGVAGNAMAGADGAQIAATITILLFGFAAFAYYVVGAASGQTMGKLARGYRTTRLDGSPLGFWRALARSFLVDISTFVFMLGWFAPLWTPRRQTWHDQMTGAVAFPGPSHRGVGPAAIALTIGMLVSIGGGVGVVAKFRDEIKSSTSSYFRSELDSFDASADASSTSEDLVAQESDDFSPAPVDTVTVTCANPIDGKVTSSDSAGDGGWEVLTIEFTNSCSVPVRVGRLPLVIEYTSTECSGRSTFDLSNEPMELTPWSSRTVQFLFNSSWCSRSPRVSWQYRHEVDRTITRDSGPTDMVSGT